MPMLIDFQCPECMRVSEGFRGQEKWCLCGITSAQKKLGILCMDGEKHLMQPIFSPKQNAQRWRHKD